MKNIGAMLKQAQQMQKKMAEMQEELAALEIAGEAAQGRVSVVLSGDGSAKRVSIAPELISDGDGSLLEDLVCAAINDAHAKREAVKKDMVAGVTEGLPLPPGMQLPF